MRSRLLWHLVVAGLTVGVAAAVASPVVAQEEAEEPPPGGTATIVVQTRPSGEDVSLWFEFPDISMSISAPVPPGFRWTTGLAPGSYVVRYLSGLGAR